MDVLIRFGFTIDEIKNMMDTNDLIDSIDDSYIVKLMNVLKEIGCSDKQIKNILLCNPFCLTKDIDMIQKLIHKLYEIGLNSLHVLFDSNPYLLTMEAQELEQLFQTKIQEGFQKEEALSYITNTIIF